MCFNVQFYFISELYIDSRKRNFVFVYLRFEHTGRDTDHFAIGKISFYGMIIVE